MKRSFLLLLSSAVMLSAPLVTSQVQAAPYVKHVHVHHKPIKRLPATAINIVFGGIKYWLSDGVYYRKQGNNYVVVKAPTGVKVRFLPNGAKVVKRNGKTFYVHGDVYYRWLPGKQRYEVVKLSTKPAAKVYKLGQVVTVLPNGANSVRINGIQYFSFNGHYFMPSQREGKSVYVVVDVS